MVFDTCISDPGIHCCFSIAPFHLRPFDRQMGENAWLRGPEDHLKQMTVIGFSLLNLFQKSEKDIGNPIMGRIAIGQDTPRTPPSVPAGDIRSHVKMRVYDRADMASGLPGEDRLQCALEVREFVDRMAKELGRENPESILGQVNSVRERIPAHATAVSSSA